MRALLTTLAHTTKVMLSDWKPLKIPAYTINFKAGATKTMSSFAKKYNWQRSMNRIESLAKINIFFIFSYTQKMRHASPPHGSEKQIK